MALLQGRFVEVGPMQIGEIKLCVGGLPKQEIADADSPPVRINNSGSGKSAVLK
jgi:hypothetical protein